MTALATVVAALVTVAGAVLTKAEPPPSRSCVQVVDEYRREIAAAPRMVDLLIAPGDDGRAVVDTDPDAVRCGVDPSTLRGLGGL